MNYIPLTPLFFLLASFQLTLFSQTPAGFPALTRNDLPGLEISQPRLFTGSSLFGYIDGGAELYLEYGFSGASVTELTLSNAKYKTEIFKMTSPEAAFGIFSVSKYKCSGTPSVARFSCQSRYQLQFCKGPWYVSVISRTGTAQDSMALNRIAGAIAGKISEADIDLSGFLPADTIEQGKTSLILAKGRLGIVNGRPEFEDFFKNLAGFTTLILDNKDNILLSARFTDDKSYSDFIKLHGWENSKISATDQKVSSGETVRLVRVNHLLIRIQK